MKKLIIASLIGISFIACNQNDEKGLNTSILLEMFPDKELSDSLYHVKLNTIDAISQGLSIPSKKENGEVDYLDFKIWFKANKEEKSRYYYKLFYQNSSYKYSEFLNDDPLTYNRKASENFYGSWEDPKEGFRFLGELAKGDTIERVDSFRIIGNPRNEARYFSFTKPRNINQQLIDSIKNEILGTAEWVEGLKKKAKAGKISFQDQVHLDALWVIENMGTESRKSVNKDSLIQVTINNIKGSEEWLNSVQQKATENGLDLEEQIRKDAEWHVHQELPQTKQQKHNIRSRRNPRMGEYEFLLVIISEDELKSIPASLRDISQVDDLHQTYLNPFYYFDERNYIPNNKGSFVIKTEPLLKASIRLSGKNGIYIDPLKLRSPSINRDFYSDKINSFKKGFNQAEFEQYFHVINKEYELRNVPVIANVIEDEYGQRTFNRNKIKYPEIDRRVSHTQITDSPGRSVSVNEENYAINISNPGNEFVDNASKENVGVASRIGMTYGKWTGKIRFPKIINDSNVWNGLTCAFWLFSDAMGEWNSRDVCQNKGYLAKGAKKYSEDRSPKTSYSEIDIEIVKTSKYWPKTSYGGVEDFPKDTPHENHNLTVTTTNWDLACPDPPKFHQGLKAIEYAGKTFEPHRWDWWYQAATTKYEYPHDKAVGKDLFYQIEWKPNEIIWRIGETKDKMEVIGYLNDEYSKIPNNQMIAIVTQEFHYSLWWPLAPYDQDNVPYPKDDINGVVHYLEVE